MLHKLCNQWPVSETAFYFPQQFLFPLTKGPVPEDDTRLTGMITRSIREKMVFLLFLTAILPKQIVSWSILLADLTSLLGFTLVHNSLRFPRYGIRISQVVVSDRMQFVVHLVYQRYPGRNIQ